jgi:hypothetical protein
MREDALTSVGVHHLVGGVSPPVQLYQSLHCNRSSETLRTETASAKSLQKGNRKLILITSKNMSTGTGMSDCCLSGKVQEGNPTGREEEIGGISTYVAQPQDGSNAKSIIFLVDSESRSTRYYELN